MEKLPLPADIWLARCARRITQVASDIGEWEARQIARAMRNFERTGVMPPEDAVDFVSQEMGRALPRRFERRTSPRG